MNMRISKNYKVAEALAVEQVSDLFSMKNLKYYENNLAISDDSGRPLPT